MIFTTSRKSEEDNLHEAIQTQEAKQNDLENYNVGIAQDLSISITAILSGLFLIIINKKIKLKLNNKLKLFTKNVKDSPCYKCEYFSNNHFLKCAVQPSVVLTEEAKQCLDYSAKDSQPSSDDLDILC